MQLSPASTCGQVFIRLPGKLTSPLLIQGADRIDTGIVSVDLLDLGFKQFNRR